MITPSESDDMLLRVYFDDGEYQLPFDSTGVHETIVPVVGWNGDELVCLGTAFAIEANGIFVTARHVIDEWVDEFGARTHEGIAGLYIIYESDREVVRPNGEPASLGGTLTVGSVSWHPDTDLAVLHTTTPFTGGEKVPISIVELTVALPRFGDKCVAIGYARIHLDGAVRPRESDDTTLARRRRAAPDRHRPPPHSPPSR